MEDGITDRRADTHTHTHTHTNSERKHIFVNHLSITHNKLLVNVFLANGFGPVIEPLSGHYSRRVKMCMIRMDISRFTVACYV